MSVTLDANVLLYAIDATAGRRHEQASAIVERRLLCQEGVIVRVVDERDLDRVMLTEGGPFSLCDALLWATCDRVGIRYLLTEDFQDRRVIGRVTYLNPFLPANASLLDLALAGSSGSSGPA